MKQRLDFSTVAPDAYKAMLGVHEFVMGCGIEHPLLHLVALRASQLNGCAFCTDMHWKDSRAAGKSEAQLALLTAWRESPGFSDRERAALAWTEAVTFVADGHVPDAEFDAARSQFSEVELVNLTLAISATNVWNRWAIAFRRTAGTYRVRAATA
jgi:AhpD family alkylhydroperoxidase